MITKELQGKMDAYKSFCAKYEAELVVYRSAKATLAIAEETFCLNPTHANYASYKAAITMRNTALSAHLPLSIIISDYQEPFGLPGVILD